MNGEKLIRMANQIGAFFEAMPDHAEAVDGVANHLRRFWEPRMREALLAYIATHGDSGLKPTVREAIHVLSDTGR
jgi:formate dehydrogenase subunit delta